MKYPRSLVYYERYDRPMAPSISKVYISTLVLPKSSFIASRIAPKRRYYCKSRCGVLPAADFEFVLAGERIEDAGVMR